MSLNKLTNLEEKNTVEIEFSIERAKFDAAVLNSYRKNVGKMNIPGFRKGKAPKNIIEKMYGKGVFYDDAFEEVIPPAYDEALKESGADAVSRPEFDIVSTEDGEDVVIKAKFYIKPEVEIENYKGLKAERPIKPVTDSDVDREIARVRDRNARTIDVTDRSVQTGDNVIIDYKGSVNGVEFEGGAAEKHNLKIGGGEFIAGFDEQIIGHNVGDEFDIDVTFPEEYHAEDLKGKPAVFHIKLHEIKYTELPELDDEFAKDISEFDTFDEYKTTVKAKLGEVNLRQADRELDENLLDALLANTTVDVPPPMLDAERENMLRDYDNRLRSQGLDLGTYFKYTGLNLESMREQFKPQAERHVKSQLALEKIAETENITVDDADLEAEFDKIAKSYSIEIEKVKESITAEMITGDLKIQKSLKFLRDNAEVTDVEKLPPVNMPTKDDPIDPDIDEIDENDIINGSDE
jgi:trigger factor